MHGPIRVGRTQEVAEVQVGMLDASRVQTRQRRRGGHDGSGIRRVQRADIGQPLEE
jgi:hypothetical protein